MSLMSVQVEGQYRDGHPAGPLSPTSSRSRVLSGVPESQVTNAIFDHASVPHHRMDTDAESDVFSVVSGEPIPPTPGVQVERGKPHPPMPVAKTPSKAASPAYLLAHPPMQPPLAKSNVPCRPYATSFDPFQGIPSRAPHKSSGVVLGKPNANMPNFGFPVMPLPGVISRTADGTSRGPRMFLGWRR